MKTSATWLLIAVFFLNCVSWTVFAVFEEGDLVELAQAAWGRSDDDFRIKVKNTVAMLPPKTRATILEKKLMESGNWGFKVKVVGGKRASQEYWVYYNKKRPSMKLYSKKTEKPLPKDEVKKVEDANFGVTTKEQPAIDVAKVETVLADIPPTVVHTEIECLPEFKSTIPAKGFADIERKLAEAKSCFDLKQGEWMAVDIDAAKSPTTVQHKYKLSRVDENVYEVALNLNFVPDESLLTKKGLSRDAAKSALNKTVQECLTLINPKLRGPGGKRLRIRLGSDSEPKPPPRVDITVGETARQHSMLYTMDITCPTITHELMHLLGLCDEYEEKSMGYVRGADGLYTLHDDPKGEKITAHDCRIVGPKGSIMNDQSSVWQSVFGKMEVLTCDCGDDLNCQRMLPTWKEHRCPPTNTAIREKRESETDFLGGPTNYTKIDGTRISIYRLATSPFGPMENSLLQPGHFNAIVNPGCEEKNSDYYACAKNAYASAATPTQVLDRKTNTYRTDQSGKHLYEMKGEGCPVPKDKLPKSCANGSTAWIEQVK